MAFGSKESRFNQFTGIDELPQSVSEAREIQGRLRSRVVLEDMFETLELIAGMDVAYPKKRKLGQAGGVILSLDSLQIREQTLTEGSVTFPYVPGYLSFREVPLLIDLYKKLRLKPQLIFCDGQGIAHPRKFGLACHLGVVCNIPTIGVAKSKLIGEHQTLPDERGSWVYLRHQGEVIGAVVRTRSDVKPVFVSPGHKVSLETAINLTLQTCTGYRIPEPTRQADHLCSSI